MIRARVLYWAAIYWAVTIGMWLILGLCYITMMLWEAVTGRTLGAMPPRRP